MFEHVAVRFQDDEHVEQEVAEVAGIERLQPRLIERIEMLPLAVGIGFPVGGIEVGGGQPAILPLVDQPRELARGPALFVEPVGLDQLLQDAKLVIGIEDREIRSEEHTSELQSLMRISYAVFCLKKKKT